MSLFDTLSSENIDKSEENLTSSVKSEPILKSDHNEETNPENIVENDISDDELNEFNPQENGSEEIDEDFSQETEEELLDIPTFLRRQAN